MNISAKHIFTIGLFLAFHCLSVIEAQFVNFGSEPFNTNWQQINTEHYQVIFPKYYHAKAQEIANYLESSFDTIVHTTLSKTYHKKPLPLILHTASTDANAFVSWAPRRMEWYTMPPPDVKAKNWLQHLSLHEQIHVAQFHQLRNKPLEILFGEAGSAALFSLLPLWYYEGEAVYSETHHNFAGRGREADFQHHYRLLSENNIRYSYDKAMFGSYKDIVPDHYSLGYQLVSATDNTSNPWENILAELSSFKTLSLFGKSLSKTTGYKPEELYAHAFDSLQLFWQQQHLKNTVHDFQYLLPENSSIHHELFAQVTNNNDIIINEKSYSKTPEIYIYSFDDNKKHRLVKTGSTHDIGFAYNKNNLIAWTEIVPDARWEARSYAKLRIYNTKTNLITTVNKKGFYFSPDFLTSTNVLTYINQQPDGVQFLEVYDVEKQFVVFSYKLPIDYHFQTPKWYDGENILIVATTNSSSKIYNLNVKNIKFSELFTLKGYKIQDPYVYQDNIYFISDFAGSSKAYVLKNNDLYCVAEINGLKGCTVYNDTLYSSIYTLNGYRAIKFPVDKHETKIGLKENKISAYPWLTSSDTSSIVYSDSTYHVTNYKRLNNLFNFHSWLPLPLIASPEVSTIGNNYTGLTLFSQNDLSTFISSFSLYYTDRLQLQSSLTYAGFFPVIRIQSLTNYKAKYYGFNEGSFKPGTEKIHNNINVSLSVPLHTNYLNKVFGITPKLSYNYFDDYVIGTNNTTYRGIHLAQFSVSAYFYTKMALRNLGPRWGSVFNFYYTPKNLVTHNFGEVKTMILKQYLPGIVPDQSLIATLGYESQNSDQWLYQQKINPVRGYERSQYLEIIRLGFQYAVPLAYPDIRLGKLLYVKRITGIPGYESSKNLANSIVPNYVTQQAILFDLITELHLLRFPLPFSVRLNNYYLPQESKYGFYVGFSMLY